MQLLLLLLALLSGLGTKMKELTPIIEQFGGREAVAAVKQAEELSEILSTLQSVTQASKQASFDGAYNGGSQSFEGASDNGYPLAPVAAIADEKITYALSRYIAENG